MQEIFSEVVLSLFKLVFCKSHRCCNRDIERIFLSLNEMQIEEIDNLRTILPSPSTENPGSIYSILTHEIIEKRIEVLERGSSHDTPKSSHFKLSLIIHLTNQLLSMFKLNSEFFFLLSIKIRSLLQG